MIISCAETAHRYFISHRRPAHTSSIIRLHPDYTCSENWVKPAEFVPSNSIYLSDCRMLTFQLIWLLFLGLSYISGSILHPRSQRQTDECSTLGVTPQCDAYWSNQEHPPLVFISLDGFRSDYINREINGSLAAPTINRLARCGIWASSGIMPSYPTVTYPNHYSIVTGLYPESHGIVDNFFYDPDLNASFSLLSDQQVNSLWWIGEPIWYTAKKQKNAITATYFWPGSDQSDPNRKPNYWYRYDGSVPFRSRMEKLLEWLKLPVSQRPDLSLVYFNGPDSTGHNVSPESPLVNDQIRRVDEEVKFLLDSLEKEGILGCIDLVVMSDHGMASSPPGEKFLIMEDYVPNISNQARIYDGVVPSIRPNLDTEEEQDRIASGLQCKDQHMRVYNKWEFPRRHHYSNSNRIPSLLLDMNVEWRAYTKEEYILAGEHGWNNLNSEMKALFVAQGPSFQKNLEVRPFHNIDLYNLMCAMIGIEPSPNNGTWGALHHLIVSPPIDSATPPIAPQTRLPYPANDATYQDHLNRNKCGLLTGTNTQAIDGSLNLTQAAIDTVVEKHAPWGSPQYDSGSDSVKLVASADYISGFDAESGLPVWTSYTLRQAVPLSSPNLPWRLDVRLERDSSSICDRSFPTDSLILPMFPFGRGATEDDMAVDTNAIDVSPSFLKYWTDFHTKLSASVAFNGETNVVIGPIRDTSSPSLFVIVTNCGNSILSECPVNRLDVQSFILPTQMKHNNDCLESDDFFATHLAMLRDISQITGLRFFPAISYRDQVDLLSRTGLSSKLLANPDPFPETEFKNKFNLASSFPKITPQASYAFGMPLIINFLQANLRN